MKLAIIFTVILMSAGSISFAGANCNAYCVTISGLALPGTNLFEIESEFAVSGDTPFDLQNKCRQGLKGVTSILKSYTFKEISLGVLPLSKKFIEESVQATSKNACESTESEFEMVLRPTLVVATPRYL